MPEFLSIDDLLEIHAHSIEVYGGASGLRDVGLLQSAAAMPQASFGGEYLHPDLFDQAAAYLFHLVQNHAFIDGNKRIGTAAALAFLESNGTWVEVDQEVLATFVIEVAQGQHDKAAISNFLRSHVKPF